MCTLSNAIFVNISFDYVSDRNVQMKNRNLKAWLRKINRSVCLGKKKLN